MLVGGNQSEAEPIEKPTLKDPEISYFLFTLNSTFLFKTIFPSIGGTFLIPAETYK